MVTPEVSERTRQAQYPMGANVPHVAERDRSAAGFHAISETVKFAAKHGPLRSLAALTVVNQKGGFDCPSCAWPDPDGDRQRGRVLRERRQGGRVGGDRASGSARSSSRSTRSPSWRSRPSSGSATRAASRTRWSCAAAASITKPIAWPDAFEMIADELNALASPDEAMFYTSGRTSNEAAFCYQLFVRQFGTNNLPDCSNMCHESSGLGLTRSRSASARGRSSSRTSSTPTAIFVIGQNPGTNHPRMLTSLEKAATQRLQDRQHQPAGGDRDDPLQAPAVRSATASAAGRRSPACSCRCASTATSRSSRGS